MTEEKLRLVLYNGLKTVPYKTIALLNCDCVMLCQTLVKTERKMKSAHITQKKTYKNYNIFSGQELNRKFSGYFLLGTALTSEESRPH